MHVQSGGPSEPAAAANPFAGGGEMGARMRAFDWSRTPLGPAETWPQSLRVVVRILLNSRYAMWLGWGPELTFFCNDAYLPTLGVKQDRALGASVRDVWAEIWSDISPRAESVLQTGTATWDEGLLLFLERSGYPEETYHTFSYSPVPDDRGGVGGLLCVVTEDTERAIGDRRLALLRELASDLSSTQTEAEVFDALRRQLSARPQDVPFALIYLAGADEPEARPVFAHGTEGAHPPAASWPPAQALAQPGLELIRNLESVFGEVPRGPWDKPPRQAARVPIAQPGQGRAAGFLVAAVNPYRPFDTAYRGFVELLAGQISTGLSNAHAYAQERERAEALAELDRAKTIFFGNVSHEFRTPLTLMLGPIEESLAEAREPVARERLELLRRNALRLQKLVNALLDFSRIEAGRIQASFAPTDLASFTAELASTFRSACEKAGLRLEVDCAPLPEPVYVDRDLWEKIVLNLVSNAFKFTLEGTISISLRAADGRAELRVRDTGTGIAPEQLPRIFERFHRVEGVRARTHEGTGIGLALVEELVQLHGGSVGAQSALGQGTEFTVAIPLGSAHLPPERIGAPRTQVPTAPGAAWHVEEALSWLPDVASAAGAALDATDAPAATAQSGERPRVLLADDNADMRAYVRRLLGERYAVEAVPDGETALRSARREPPDLLLSDVMMPGLDGLGLLRELRADPRTQAIPVILLSARAGEESRVEGLDWGADDYLIKPFSARELLARVAAALERARVRRESEAAVRESEMRFRQLADHAPVLIWVMGAQGCEFVNREYLSFIDGDFEDVRDMRWTKFLHPEDSDAYLGAYRQALLHREPFEAQVRMRRADGEYRWLRSRGVPRFPADGTPLGYIGCSADITEIKRSEEALRDADRRKDEFLATLAHELRNPLAPIRNALQLLQHSGPSPRSDKMHAVIDRQVHQLVRLVDDLMEVSRITRGKIELRREPVELASIVRDAVETSQPLIDAAGHRLRVELPREPLLLEADAVRLVQVLANLLGNAAKYTDAGGSIRLAARTEDGEVRVSVRDSGIGIPAHALPKVFDLFTQFDRAHDGAQGGLGIGLTLVKRLVEMHGGRVEAHSEGRGSGSEFVVFLPLASGARASATASAAPPPALERARVLVVDDNRDAADMLALLLDTLGLEVRVAYGGAAALAALREFHPAVALMDLGMPGMDGYEVARRIREQPQFRDVLLVALTGWGQFEDRRRSTEAGFDRHFVKPIEFDTLQSLFSATDRAARR